MKFYTGVGSRKTPQNILKQMTSIAVQLEALGYILRSGGAGGADQAFESNTFNKEIFYAKDASPDAMELAAKFHGAWHLCSDYAKKLHGRNSFQVMGRDLATPSDFLICWTADGCESHKERTIKTGGTGTAISIADHFNIPIINMALSPTNTHHRLNKLIK